MDWQADSIQAIAFTSPTAPTVDAASLWSSVFPGDSPDAYQRNPTAPNLQTAASGERNGFNVGITSQIGQLIFSANPVLQQLPGMIPVQSVPPRIKNYRDAATLIISLLKKSITDQQCSRVAVILDLALSVQGALTASLLKSALPEVPFPAGSIEPAFGFNAQAPVPYFPGVEMNRICAWTAGQVGFMSGNMQGIQQAAPVTFSNYIGFKIDVNTVPRQQLPAGVGREVLDILLQEAIAISADGLSHFQ